MKTNRFCLLTLLISMLMSFMPCNSWAYDAYVNGIYYNLNKTARTASVTYKTDTNLSLSYSGSVTIPAYFTYSGILYSVTSIGDLAFANCPVSSVKIPYGVTSIGSQAFTGSSLTSVSIPNSVTSIGETAFWLCLDLTDVTIGSAVTYIGFSAFYQCSALSSVTLGSSVKTIENSAFGACPALTSITIPKSVTAIGESVFAECTGLASITVESGNSKYDSRDDCNAIIETSTNSLISGCKNTTIPNGVTDIYYDAFKGCTNLSDISIPSSVTSIKWSAFSGCSGLTSITVESETPASAQYNSFNGVDKSNCTLYVPLGCKTAYQNASYWSEFENIVELGNNQEVLATGSCGDNLTYTIYSDMSMVISGTGAMRDYSRNSHINDEYYKTIQAVIIEDGVSSIGEYAFSGCVGLISVEIPNSVTNIGYSAFEGCTGLTSIMIPNSVTSTGGSTFYGCTGLTSITIPNSVTTIGYSAFYGCTGLTSIEIPTSVTSFGNYAFYDCIGLTSIEIPNSVTSIGDNAFDGCTGLTSIEIPNSVTSIGVRVFDGCTGLTMIEIPNSVTSIGAYAFNGCTGLTSIEIPNSVTSINSVSFSGCKRLAFITVERDNKEYDSRDNCNGIIETASNTLLFGCQNTIIPNSVTSIGDYAFSGCTGLTSIEIPNSVTGIGDSAFNGCTGLTSIDIPNSVTSIGGWVFSGCAGVTSITVGWEVPLAIDSYVFRKIDKTACNLYVPFGTKSAYESADVWKEFENIVEYGEEPDTDLSTLANAIYVEPTEGRIGGTMDIPVKMKNDYDVRGFQFTMELPEGAVINSWALSTDRLPSGVTTSDKMATQSINGNKIVVVCSLNYGNATFTGNDGEIATVNVTFPDDMEAGSYPIYLTACASNDASGFYNPELSDVKATLVLEDYLPGDANGDGKVMVGDVTAILNYIVGSAPDGFNAKAADVNGDGKVMVGDVTAVLNIIVNQ